MPYGCWQPINQAVAYTCIIMHGIISYLGTSVQDLCQRKHTCDAFLLKQPQSFSPGILSVFLFNTIVSRISACVCNTHVNGNTSPMFSHWNHFVVSVSRYLVLSYTVVSRTSARMCHTHVNGDTSPMFSYWHHFIVSVHGYLVLSYTVVSRTSAPVLPPSSY